MASTRDHLVDYAFRAGWTITRHSPEPVAAQVLESIADRLTRQRGDGVRQLERNQRRAAPDLTGEQREALLRDGMRSYFRYWHEAFRLPSLSAERIVSGVVTTGEQPLREVFARGRGTVIALPHMGNWDMAGAWACLTGMPVSTVAERLQPETLYDRFVAYREQLGMEVVPLTGGASPLREMEAALRRGRLVCLLADRDLSRHGIEVELLGEPARVPVGPARLSQLTGAPVVPLALHYEGPLLHLDFGEPLWAAGGSQGLLATTQAICDHFSGGLRTSPQDWHMLQHVFVTDLDPERLRRTLEDEASG